MVDHSSTFADRLAEALRDRKISKAELARLTGIDKSNISHYCSGKYKAKQDVVYKIALVLDVSEAWLMGYNVPKDREHEPVSEAINKPDTSSYEAVLKWIQNGATAEEKLKLMKEIAKEL